MSIVHMVLMKLFTESWLDQTLSDPFQHSAAAWDIVWQVAHDHHTDLAKYQIRLVSYASIFYTQHFKDTSYLPQTLRYSLASKTTAISLKAEKYNGK